MVRLTPGVNDLATTHPELVAEWHPTKNGSLTPQRVSFGSEKKVWWLGKCGHEWQALVCMRAKGQGCLICSNRQIQAGINDLASQHPDVMLDWDFAKNSNINPDTVGAGSNKSVFWKCHVCGNEWKTTIYRRVFETGCPCCSEQKRKKAFNDALIAKNGTLLDNSPSLAAEWHPTKNGELTPSDVLQNSHKKIWWLCPRGHSYLATVHNRNTGYGCPICASEQQSSFPEQAVLYYAKKVTSAESRNMEFGKEMDVWLPELRTGIEYNGYWHKDRKKADADKLAFFASKDIRLITIKESDQNRVVGDVIEYIYHVTNKESLKWAINSLFQLLHLRAPLIDLDTDSQDIYSQYIYSEKEKSLAAKSPELVAEWHPTKNGDLKPTQVTPGSNKKVWWLGKCGHEWPASIANRSRLGRGCPICAGKLVLSGTNDFASAYPELAAEWHPTKNDDLKPTQVTPGSNKKVWWLGKCGHEWQAVIAKRSLYERGCPVCARKRVWETRRKNLK